MDILSSIRHSLSRLTAKASSALASESAQDQGLVAIVRQVSRPATLQTIPEAYKLNPWAFTATNAISQNASSVPIRLMDGRGKEEPDEVDSGPPIDELTFPNPTCTGFQLWEATVSWLVLSGNAFWFVVFNRFGFPREIYYLDPRRIEIERGSGVDLRYYVRPDSGARRELPAEQLVHFKTFNPFNPFYGMSPLAVLRMAIEADIGADQLNLEYMLNSAEPHGVLTSDQERMTDKDIKRLREMFESQHQGQGKRWKPAVLWKGLKYQQTQASHRDIAFKEMGEITREKIFAVLGVNNAVAGIPNQNFATQVAESREFWTRTVQPMNRRIAETMALQLLPMFARVLDFDPAEDRASVWFEHDYSGVQALADLLGEQEKAYNLAIKNGSMTINEVRALRGQAPVEWGEDWHHRPIQALLAGQQQEPDGEKALRSLIHALAVETLEEDPASAAALLSSAEPQRALPAASVQDEPTKLDGNTRRKMAWKTFVQRSRPQERAIQKSAQDAFRKQRERVISRLTEWDRRRDKAADDPVSGLGVSVLFDTEEEAIAFWNVLGDSVGQAVKDFGDAALSDLALETGYQEGASFEAFMRGRLEKQTLVQEATRGELEKAITAVIQGEDTVQELRDRVLAIYDKADEVRAAAVARTEATSAANFGQVDAWKQSKVVSSKEWISSRDGNERQPPDSDFDHAAADGEIVKLDEQFTGTGEPLEYPGDSIGSAGNVINCRCTMVSVVDEEALVERGISLPEVAPFVLVEKSA